MNDTVMSDTAMNDAAPTWPSWPGSPIRVQLTDHETERGELVVGSGGDRQVLVLVHAALLDRHMWAPFVERLTPQLPGAWRVVVYDLRGHGAAADNAPPITGIDQLAADLWALVDALPAERVHLAGLSLGGAVVQMAALTAPDRVASLTLVGTSPRFPADVMERRAQLSDAGVAAEVPETLARWFGPTALTDGGRPVDYARRKLLAAAPERWAQTWRALGGFNVVARLSEIRAPVLAIAGADDKASPPSASRQIVESIGHGRLIVIDDAAHLLALDHADAVAPHVGEFLRELAL